MSETLEIQFRLERIYAAVEATTVEGLGEVIVKERRTDSSRIVEIKAFGDKSDADVSNAAAQVNALVAHFGDHLRGWARQNGRSPDDVSSAADASFELNVVRDLAEQDKHGGDRRDGGRSKRSPRIESLERVIRLTSSPGNPVGLRLAAGGLKQMGTGSVHSVITGRVVDGSGQLIGNLDEVQAAALSVWEKLLTEWGLLEADED